MPAMLRHKPTGDLYIRTGLLAARDDMEAVEDSEPAIEDAAPAKGGKGGKGNKKAEEAPVEVPVVDNVDAVVEHMFGDVTE